MAKSLFARKDRGSARVPMHLIPGLSIINPLCEDFLDLTIPSDLDQIQTFPIDVERLWGSGYRMQGLKLRGFVNAFMHPWAREEP